MPASLTNLSSGTMIVAYAQQCITLFYACTQTLADNAHIFGNQQQLGSGS